MVHDSSVHERILRLWDELADFGLAQSDRAAEHFMQTLCALVGAHNATWGGAIRVEEETAGDALRGWRVAAMKLLQPIEPHPDEGPFREILRQWDRREIDASFLLPMRGVGEFRTYAFRRDLPMDWFDSPFYRVHYAAVGTVDAAFVAFPLNADAESHFGFYADRRLGEADIAALAFAVRGIKWFHRLLMLNQGLLVARAPLTPAERKVLHLLLTEASEKGIADQIGIAASTVHQHVGTIFGKFGVRSRAGLMSLWLGQNARGYENGNAAPAG